MIALQSHPCVQSQLDDLGGSRLSGASYQVAEYPTDAHRGSLDGMC